VTKLVYTPRALFYGLFRQICSFILSFYIAGRLVTVPREISVKMSSHTHKRLNGHYSVRGQVWSVYGTYIKGIRLRVAEIWSYEVYSKLPPADILDLINWKWCLSIRRPRKLQPGTKHEGDRMMRCRVMAIWHFPKCVNWPWGRSSVGRSAIFTFLTLISYTPFSLR